MQRSFRVHHNLCDLQHMAAWVNSHDTDVTPPTQSTGTLQRRHRHGATGNRRPVMALLGRRLPPADVARNAVLAVLAKHRQLRCSGSVTPAALRERLLPVLSAAWSPQMQQNLINTLAAVESAIDCPASLRLTCCKALIRLMPEPGDHAVLNHQTLGAPHYCEQALNLLLQLHGGRVPPQKQQAFSSILRHWLKTLDPETTDITLYGHTFSRDGLLARLESLRAAGELDFNDHRVASDEGGRRSPSAVPAWGPIDETLGQSLRHWLATRARMIRQQMNARGRSGP